MNKIIKKTVGKINILSIISAVILVVAVVVLAIFGYSTDAVSNDVNTLTVNVNQYAYNEYSDKIEESCNDVFDELNLSYSYDMKGEMIGDESEIVYVFKKDVDLKTAVEKLNSAFDAATANDGVLAGSIIRVTTNIHSHSNPLQSGFCPNAPSKPCLLMTPVLVLTGLHHCSEHSRGPLFPAVLRATVHTALQPLPLLLCPPTFLPRAPSAAATPGTDWPFKAHSHPALVSGTLPPDGSLPHCLQVEQEDSRPWPPVADLAPRAGPWYSPPAHKQFMEHQCPDKTTL